MMYVCIQSAAVVFVCVFIMSLVLYFCYHISLVFPISISFCSLILCHFWLVDL